MGETLEQPISELLTLTINHMPNPTINKDEVIKELTALKVEFNPRSKPETLAKLLADTKAANASAGSGTQPEESEDDAGVKTFLLLKTRAYVNKTDRVEAGVYLLSASAVPERLAKLPTTACEQYDATEVPMLAIQKAAHMAGYKTDGLKDKELSAIVFEKIAMTKLRKVVK